MRWRASGGHALARGRSRRRRWIVAGLVGTLLVSAYALWPRVTLWRLDRALMQNDRDALAALVDLDGIRRAIHDRLNKESDSDIGPVSDAFIQWLEEAIRRDGSHALEEQIDLDWVRSRLLANSPLGAGLCVAVTDAGFRDPVHYVLRIGAADRQPVHATLTYRGNGWRLTALHF